MQIEKFENGAAVVTYVVLAGPYIVRVRMLNLNERTKDELTTSSYKGAFGRIILLADER